MQVENRSISSLLIGNSAGVKRKSQALPLPRSHISRTESEIQMEDDQAEAERRDHCMFRRIVFGIAKQQEQMYETLCRLKNETRPQGHDNSDNLVNEVIVRNQKCLDHIVHTQRQSLNTRSSTSPCHRCYLEAAMVDEKTSDTDKKEITPTYFENASSKKSFAVSAYTSSGYVEKQEVDASEQDFFFFEL